MPRKRNGEYVTCAVCGKVFYVSPSRVKEAKYCSRKCLAKHRSTLTGKKNRNWRGGKVERQCEICDKKFYVKQKTVRNGFGRFCSRKCFGVWRSRDLVGEDACNWQGGEIELICEICGEPFYVNRYRLEKESPRYCSRECNWAGRSGELSWCWMGGISFDPYPPEFNGTLKRFIRERDDYTCAICGEYGNNVHHIDYDKQNCSPENLITLCQSCHSKTNIDRDNWRVLLQERICDGRISGD